MGDVRTTYPVFREWEKTALKLLYEYQSVDRVLENIQNIKGKKLKEKSDEIQGSGFAEQKIGHNCSGCAGGY